MAMRTISRRLLCVLALGAGAPGCAFLAAADTAKSGIVLLKSATRAPEDKPEGPATPPSLQPAALTNGVAETRPIAVLWDGMAETFAGKIELSRAQDRSATVSFAMPGGQPSCTGTLQFAARSHGTWTVGCTDGNVASGTLAPIEPGKQSLGEGSDSRGRRVRIAVGDR
jgi:hypothetical protein